MRDKLENFVIHTSNLNRHCKIPDNVFIASTVLHPNSSREKPPILSVEASFKATSTISLSAEAFNPRVENPGAVMSVSLYKGRELVQTTQTILPPREPKTCKLEVPQGSADKLSISVRSPDGSASHAYTGIRLHPIIVDNIGALNELDGALAAVSSRTLLDPQRLQTLWTLAQEVSDRGILGDLVECGSYRGGAAGLLGLASSATSKRLWLYDSFEGMPAPTAIDGQDATVYTGKLTSSPEEVGLFLSSIGIPVDRTEIVPGWFSESFRARLPEQISVLHCDADWYESVKLVLETMYPRVSDGGYVILDDFGYWEGCRAAFYDFCRDAGIAPLLERTGKWQAHWQKGREHNRGK